MIKFYDFRSVFGTLSEDGGKLKTCWSGLP